MEQQQKSPAEIRKAVNFLRSSKAGIKTRVGILNGKRVDYFKGKAAIKAVMSPAYAKLKGVPPVSTEQEAITVLNSAIPFAFYLRVDRGQSNGSGSSPQNQANSSSTNGSAGASESRSGSGSSGSGSPKQLSLNHLQTFRGEDYYAWFYEGPMWTTYLGGLAMVIVLLAGVMFPLWPQPLRLGVWYLSIGVLGLVGLFIVIAILRLIFYVITLIAAPPGIWVFPKLFADVGVIESFIPLWEWDVPRRKKSKKRTAGVGAASSVADNDTTATDKKGKGKARDSTASASASASASYSGIGTGSAYIEEVETDSLSTSGDGDSRPVSSRSSRMRERVEDAPED